MKQLPINARTLLLAAALLAGLSLGACSAFAQPATAPASIQAIGKPADFPAPRFDPPPRLAITRKELAALKASPDFPKIKAAAVAAAAPLIAKPIQLPDGYASWIFYYCNPDNGVQLQPVSLTEHKDPTTGKIFTDDRTIAAYRCILHNNLEHATVTLGWAYAYTDDEKYAAEVRRIFLKLANDYDTYPKRLDRWGRTGWFANLGGRRYVQSLEEGVGMTRLAKGYDLTRNSKVFSDDDRKLIEEKFFRATADTLLWFNQDINNHQTWYDAGLVCIASTLADEKLLDKVLTMRGGFFDQLNRSIGSDGLWYEGAMAYHNYALQALLEQVEVGRRLGLPLHEQPKFKLMFSGPIRAAYPNGQVPAINDSDPGDISMFNHAWEWAWKTYRDPFYAQALAKGDQAKLDAMLGANSGVKAQWPVKLKSEAMEDVGLAVLRMGEGPTATCAFIDYGQHGGGHGHFDKLNLMLFAAGREWLMDCGRIGYTHKEYKTWAKMTSAHNTVAIGGRIQEGTTGKLIYVQQENDFAAAVTESDRAFLGSVLKRHVLLTQNFLVDIFDVKADGANQIELFAHCVAEKLEPATQGLPEGTPMALGDTNGYQHLTSGAVRKIDGDSTWDYIAGKQRLRMFLAGSPAEQIFTCIGIGYNVNQKTPTLVRRRHAERTRFVAVYDLTGEASSVTKVTQGAGDVPSVTVETKSGTFEVEFGATAATMKKR